MARRKGGETTPRNRQKEAIQAQLQKFVPQISLAGDGLIVAAFLNQMGVSAETLLNVGGGAEYSPC